MLKLGIGPVPSRHHFARVAPWGGRPRHPHDGEGRRRQDRAVQRRLLLRLDTPRARRDRALLRHPFGARTVEPAIGPVPVVLPGEGKCKEIATAGSDLRGGGRPLLQQTFSRVVDAAEKSL
jgi:hypothetical protein